jgi:ribonuclease III
MSRPRLHQDLELLYQQKNPSQIDTLLEHAAYAEFAQVHNISLPNRDLAQAFTHASFTHEFGVPHQEQLEFLGDAVLQLILTEELCRRYPDEKEGKLSKLRSATVNEGTLAKVARDLKLGELLLLGKGEYQKGLAEQNVVLADTLEALIAQVYRFEGLECTKQLVLQWFELSTPETFDLVFLESFDSKSKVQELSLARYKKLPRYEAQALGDKFTVRLYVNESCVAEGVFSSKKGGEKELAAEVIKKGLI